MQKLSVGKQVETDKGYRGKRCVCYPCNFGNSIYKNDAGQKAVRWQHKHINTRLKMFKVLESTFRGDDDHHGDVFQAVAVCTQLSIYGGQRLAQIVYPNT